MEVFENATNKGFGDQANEVARVMGEKTIEQVSAKEVEVKIENSAKAAAEKVSEELKGIIPSKSESVSEKEEFIAKTQVKVEEVTQDLLIDREIAKTVDTLIKGLPESNKQSDNSALTRVDPTLLASEEKLTELKVVTKMAVGKAIAAGELTPTRVAEEINKLSGINLSPFSAQIETALNEVSKLVSNNPTAAATYTDNISKNELIVKVLDENPNISTKEAVEYSETVTKFFSPKSNPVNATEIEKAVAEAKSGNKTEISDERYKESFWKLSSAVRVMTMSPEENG